MVSFSVVIANYNYGRYLRQAVDSALTQDVPQVEVVVVDDGSSDNSREVIESYGSRIRAVFQENAGQREANNRGFVESSGDVILFLDADDVLLPGALRAIAESWRPGLSKVQGLMRRVDENMRDMGVVVPPLTFVPTPLQIREWASETFEYPTPPGSGNAWSRSFLEQIFPLDDSCDNFTDSSCIAAAPWLGDVVTILRPLVLYRMHGGNDSNIVARDTNYAREVRRAVTRFRFARHVCEMTGHTPPSRECLFRGSNLLQFRIASLRLTPGERPLPGDSLLRALGDALMVPFRPGFQTAKRRWLITIWSVLVILLPDSASRWLIIKRYR